MCLHQVPEKVRSCRKLLYQTAKDNAVKSAVFFFLKQCNYPRFHVVGEPVANVQDIYLKAIGVIFWYMIFELSDRL